MPDECPDDAVEHFRPAGGRVIGVWGVLLAMTVVVTWALNRDDVSASVAALALFVGVAVWAALLRPRVSATRETLILCNMLETVHVPLAAVDEMVVRQVLALRVGDKRFVSPAVGRKLRTVMRAPKPNQLIGPRLDDVVPDEFGKPDPERPVTEVDYVDHVEQRIRELIADAHQRHGVRTDSEEAQALARGVRREPAWPEIGALALTAALCVVTLLV